MNQSSEYEMATAASSTYFDQTLSWTGHVDSLCKSISQRLVLRRIRHYLPYKARVAFYNCLILSLMDYCCVLWGNTSKQNLDRIYSLQKRAARLILDADGKAPSLPLRLAPNSRSNQVFSCRNCLQSFT